MRYLCREDVAQTLTMAEAIVHMGDAFRWLSNGSAKVPVRTQIHMETSEADGLFMPVYAPELERVGVKMVTVAHQNPSQGLPLIHGLLLVSDAKTGVPLALMDGEHLTALRTGAASGLATDLLALPDLDEVAIFGAGIQAETQLEAMCAVRPISKAYVVNRDQERGEAFCRRMAEKLGITVLRTTAKEAVEKVQLICCATTAREPLFESEWCNEGLHVNAVGGYRPDMCELPPALMADAEVIVDHRASCVAEAGEIVRAQEAGLLSLDFRPMEIGELVEQGTSDSLRHGRSVFKSVGNAVQDLVAAAAVLRIAEEKGLGTRLKL